MSTPDRKQMLYVSPAYQRMWGVSADTLYAHSESFLDAIHPDDRERVRLAQANKLRGDYDEDYRVIHRDGSLHWVHSRAFPIRDALGEVYRIAGILEDITERKRAEDELRQNEQKLSEAQQIGPVGQLGMGCGGRQSELV